VSATEPERVIDTPVPGLVLWQWPRRTIIHPATKEKRRARTYSLTHEASGYALLPGADGKIKATTTIADGIACAVKLGDVRWRGRPVDWTKPLAELETVRRIRLSCMVVAGWRVVLGGYDAETHRWAERNGINLGLPAVADDRRAG
jgi:hypothetical protein